MAEHCDFCDLPKDQCPHGRPVSVDDLVQDGPTIEAQTHSDCVGCGQKINPGDRITHTAEGWAHTREVIPKSRLTEQDDAEAFRDIA